MVYKNKILHLVEAFGGGVYFFLKDLLNHPELEEFDFEILFARRGPLEDEQLKEDFPRVKFSYWPFAQREISPYQDFKAFRAATRFIKQSKPDLIHCHSSKAGVLGRASAFVLGQGNRVIYSPHGLSFLKLDDPKWKRKVYQYIEKFSAKLGGTVVGCSPSEVKALTDGGIAAQLIQSGTSFTSDITVKKFSPPIKVITVGQIYVPKNPGLFNEIAEALPDIEFVWVGDGDLRNLLTAKNILVTGWRPREEIASFLHDAHVYLSTSLWEGLPLAVLEAMSNGMPLLLSRCVGNVDLVKEENGFLFTDKIEAIEKLKEMTSQPLELQKMGEASRGLVKDSFSIEAMAKNYRNLYLKKLQYRRTN